MAENLINQEKLIFQKNMPVIIETKTVKEYPIHWHEGVTEIILPLQGSVEVIHGIETSTVYEGDFLFINNKALHALTSSTAAVIAIFHINLQYFERQFEYLRFMSFRSNLLFADINRLTINIDDDIRRENKLEFRNLLFNLLYMKENNTLTTARFHHEFEHKLINSMVYEFNWLQFLRTSKNFISSVQLDRYHRIIKYIAENFTEKITLDDIVGQEFITKTHLSHLWKNVSSYSFQERINYERVVASVFLLLSGKTSISKISEQCGFSDVKYYYKSFKRWYGCMPLEYRQWCLAYIKGSAECCALRSNEISDEMKRYIKKYRLILSRSDSTFYPEIDSELKNFYDSHKLINEDKRLPKYVLIINLFDSKNHRVADNKIVFNWYNIDVCLNRSINLGLNLQIHLKIEDAKHNYVMAIEKFIEWSISRYGVKTVQKWQFLFQINNIQLLKTVGRIEAMLQQKLNCANICFAYEL